MSNIYYVYIYLDPRTNIPFYVGKGKGNRFKSHLIEKKNYTTNKRKYEKIQELNFYNLTPTIIFYASNLDEQVAYNIEAELIKRYGRLDLDDGGVLTNICLSNDPPNTTGSKRSKETKLLMSLRQMGNKKGIFNKGKRRTEEQRKNLSNSSKGKSSYKRTPEIIMNYKKAQQTMGEARSKKFTLINEETGCIEYNISTKKFMDKYPEYNLIHSNFIKNIEQNKIVHGWKLYNPNSH